MPSSSEPIHCEADIENEAQLREFVAVCEVAAAALSESEDESDVAEIAPSATTVDADETIYADETSSTGDAERDDIQLEALLHRCHGDHEFAGLVLEKFRKRLPEELVALRRAVDAQDVDQVRTVARQLKARAGQVGATSVSREAAALEVAVVERSSSCDLSALERNADACLDSLDRLLRAFNHA